MNIDKYASFTVQDFLADDDFIQWVIEPTDDLNKSFQLFTEACPQKKEMVEMAAATIRTYRSQDTFYNEQQADALWQRIGSSIKTPPAENTRAKIFGLTFFMRAAAVLLAVAGLCFWLITSNASREYSYATAFGEVKTITLPDASQVTLNGNSSVTYSSNWNKKTVREVWIKGEGYFNVTHINKDSADIKPAERFIVHCGDVNIEVLGTTFNVKARHGKTNIALITGKIRIDYAHPAAGNKPVIMSPGDYVAYASKKLVETKKLLKPAQVSTWRASEISFTDATLKEIGETLQDSYGYEVAIKDTSLYGLKIEGDISVNSVADLLDVVSTTLNIKIEQSAEKHITITK